MKRVELMKRLKAIAKDRGLDFAEHEGGGHTIVNIGGQSISIPRHKEINEITARKILETAEEG